MFYYGKNILLEDNRGKQARNKAKEIISNAIRREGGNVEQLTNAVLNSYEELLFSNSKIKSSQVMRLFPIFCRFGMENGMYITNPTDVENNPKTGEFFERIKRIINYLYTLNLRGENLSNISLNTTFEDIESFYGEEMEKEQNEENERIANAEYNENGDYTVVGPLDFETAKKYGDLSAWQHRGEIKDGEICYTQKIETWNKYTFENKHTVYVILKNGWENLPPNNTKLEPFNEYGLSMIFVIVNEKGELVWCNTRLNHFADYSKYGKHVDHALTKEEISRLIGRKFDEVFIPKQDENEESKKWEAYSAECDRRIANGEPLDEIFEYFDRIMLKYKKCCKVENEDYECNIYVPNKGILVKNQWFDDVDDYYEGFFKVKLNGLVNIIDLNGEYRSEQWFDDADLDEGLVEYGLIIVYNEGKRNILNAKTKNLISNIWFDDTDYVDEDDELFEKGIILKCLTSKREIFYLDKNGRLHNSLNEHTKKKMKTIIISESQARMLKENIQMINEEVTFHAFMSHVKDYLKQLLTNPIGAQPDAFLKSNGLGGEKLLSKLIDKDIIIKKSKIVSEGKDRFEISYKLPRNNFERKMRRLYAELFDDDSKKINENVNEELLAPNGKPSKLPKKLWELVRTPQFKNWFGDWENNPESASKIVHPETGEPLVVYHGSPNDFNTFSLKHFATTSDCGSMGKGFYFTPHEKYAGKYGNFVKGFFLNIRQPLISTDDTQIECFVLGSPTIQDVYDRIDKQAKLDLVSQDQIDYIKNLITPEMVSKVNSLYDGVMPPVSQFFSVASEIVTLRGNQIKSINNLGNFSSESDDVNEACLHEDGASAVSGPAGATTCDASSGAFIQPMSSTMIKRSIYGMGGKTEKKESNEVNEEAVMDTAIGDFGFDAPPFKRKKKDPAYDHRNMMKKSFRRK